MQEQSLDGISRIQRTSRTTIIRKGKRILNFSVANLTDDSLDSQSDSGAGGMKITEDCLVCDVPPVGPAGPATELAPNNLLGALDALPMVAPSEHFYEKEFKGGFRVNSMFENKI